MFGKTFLLITLGVCSIVCVRSLNILKEEEPCWKICQKNNKAQRCSHCRMPEETGLKMVEKACADSSNVTGCAIASVCRDADSKLGYCDPFSLLADICSTADEAIIGCDTYNGLCSAGTKFSQCQTNPSIVGLPGDRAVRQKVWDACRSMPMDACQQCTAHECTNPLLTLAQLCGEMDMPQCDVLSPFCGTLSAQGADHLLAKAFHCPTSHPQLPRMLMYFHTGMREYILFQGAVPESATGFAVALVLIVAAGVATTGAKSYRLLLEIHWRLNPILKSTGSDRERLLPSHHIPDRSWDSVLVRNLVRGGLTTVTTAIDYALMLVAMTFNVWVFLAVVLGFSLGQVCFGHVGRSDVYEATSDRELWHEAIVSIHGMTCDSCVATVQRAVLALPVERLVVEREAERALVVFNANLVSVVEIVESINNVGFEASAISEQESHLNTEDSQMEVEILQSCCE